MSLPLGPILLFLLAYARVARTLDRIAEKLERWFPVPSGH